MNSARIKAYIMLLVVALSWGIASPIIKYTLDAFDPAVFLAYRYFISTIIAVVTLFFVKQHLPKKFPDLILLFIYAFLNSVVSLGLLFFGMQNTTVLDMSLITLVGPLIVSATGVYYFHEKITKREKIGMAIAVLGVLITIIEPMYLNGNNTVRFSGNLLVFGNVIVATITTVISKKLLRNNVNPLLLVNTAFIVGFISFLAYTLYTNTLDINVIYQTPPIYHFGVLYMAAISGTLAYYLSTKAQKTIEISEQSLFSYLSPIFSMPIAVIWLGEKITPSFIIGAVIIAFGVALAEIKRTRYNKTQ
jgi:drug/metabolite transporter (DMT)-like permease